MKTVKSKQTSRAAIREIHERWQKKQDGEFLVTVVVGYVHPVGALEVGEPNNQLDIAKGQSKETIMKHNDEVFDREKMKKARTLKELWDEFEKIMPKHCSRTQRVETRRAFYAGAQALFHLLIIQTGDGDHEPTAEDMQLMNNIQQEFSNFARDIQAGRA